MVYYIIRGRRPILWGYKHARKIRAIYRPLLRPLANVDWLRSKRLNGGDGYGGEGRFYKVVQTRTPFRRPASSVGNIWRLPYYIYGVSINGAARCRNFQKDPSVKWGRGDISKIFRLHVAYALLYHTGSNPLVVRAIRGGSPRHL